MNNITRATRGSPIIQITTIGIPKELA